MGMLYLFMAFPNMGIKEQALTWAFLVQLPNKEVNISPAQAQHILEVRYDEDLPENKRKLPFECFVPAGSADNHAGFLDPVHKFLE